MDDPAIVTSNGILMGIDGIYYDEIGEPYPVSFGGHVVSCHDADLIEGAIDWNLSGTIEPNEWLDSVEGDVNICNQTLSIYDFVLEGERQPDYEATYVGSGY